MNLLNKQFEDELAQTLLEKEKEYALILDAKMIEYEDQILDTENRLHRDYIEKIIKFQEIIKDLKKENESLYEETSLKQKQIDDNINAINQLKDTIKVINNQVNVSQKNNSTSSKLDNINSYLNDEISLTSGNKENEANYMNKSSMHKSPIENLQGYYNNLKSSRNSRTRNSNSNIQSLGTVNNIPKASKSSIKRCRTSLNGSDANSFMRSIDESRSFEHQTTDSKNKSQAKYNENVTLSSRYVNNFKVNKGEINNSTYMEMESENDIEQTPVKSKIVNLQSKTKEK